jgi:hypothetical protein
MRERVPFGVRPMPLINSPMDCREFRNKHVAFVDDLLPAFEMERMHRHLEACARCSRQDTAVRRSLLLVRNLPPIEPSPDFMQRLNARLDALGPEARTDVVSRPYFSSVGAFTALAAGIAAVAYLAIETSNYFAMAPQLVPAVASASVASSPLPLPAASAPAPSLEPVSASMADAAFVASVPTGMPVWPAVLMVGQAPLRFANLDFHDANLTR